MLRPQSTVSPPLCPKNRSEAVTASGPPCEGRARQTLTSTLAKVLRIWTCDTCTLPYLPAVHFHVSSFVRFSPYVEFTQHRGGLNPGFGQGKINPQTEPSMEISVVERPFSLNRPL